jgi:O-antigen/teichoic acid export membrane protein
MKMKRRVIVDAANLSTTNLFIAGTQFLEILVLARTLLPSDLGLIALIAIIFGLVRSVADLGTGNALIHFQTLSRRAFSSIYWLLILFGIVLFGLGLAGHFLLVHFQPHSLLSPFVGWIGFSFLIFPIGGLYQFQFQKELRFRRIAVIEVGARCCETAIVVLLAMTGHGVFSYIAGQIGYTGVKSIGQLIAGFQLVRPVVAFDFAEASAVLRFGAFQMGERLVAYLAVNVDYLTIGKFLGMRDLGFYKIAYELVVAPLRLVNPVFGSLALPRFAKNQHDDGALREGILATLHLLSLSTFPLLLGLCATGGIFISVVYGPGWGRAAPLICLLTLMGLCKIIGNLSGSIVIAKGRVQVGFVWNCIIAAGNGAVFLLVVHWGVGAVAAAYSLLSFIFLLISFPNYYRSTIGLRLREYFGSFMMPTLLSLAMAAIVYGASCSLRGVRLLPLVELFILIAVGIAAYSAMNLAIMGQRGVEVLRSIRRRDGSSLLDLLAGRQSSAASAEGSLQSFRGSP